MTLIYLLQVPHLMFLQLLTDLHLTTLTSTSLTSPSTFLHVTENSVMVATSDCGAADPLITLNKLSNR